MKKIILMLVTILLLTGCFNKSEVNKEYQEFISMLKSVDKTSEDIPLNISINVTDFNEDLLTYTALIDKSDEEMFDIKALLIHDKKTENAFPSVGIYDPPVTIDKSSTQKGIKLTGYVENYDEINFKLIVTYKDASGNLQKYYYIYNYRQ